MPHSPIIARMTRATAAAVALLVMGVPGISRAEVQSVGSVRDLHYGEVLFHFPAHRF